jgi:hypothetical protein
MGIELLLGHLVGDYLFQWQEIANKKKDKSLVGLGLCIMHCTLYTLAIFLFIKLNLLTAFLIVISHFLVDRFNWLHKIHLNIMKRPEFGTTIGMITYVVTDNTIHLVSMYLILKLL